jgi:hypothetical protein
MRSRRHQQQSTRRIRGERRRLGRFVAFAEIKADLTPVSLFNPPLPSEAASASKLEQISEQGAR